MPSTKNRARAPTSVCDSPSTLKTPSLLLRAGLVAALTAAFATAAPFARAQDSSRVAPDSLEPIQTSDPGIELLRSMVRAGPDVKSVRLRLAQALFEGRQYAEAAEHYAEYISGLQASPQIIRNYLFALAQVDGGLAAGERTALEYSRIYPTDAEIHMRLGYFRLWQGKHRLALASCEQALRLDPRSEQSAACVRQASGPAPAAGGSHPVDRLARQLRADPGDDSGRFRLVGMLVEADRFQEAWNHLLVLEPEYGYTARWLDEFLKVESGLARPDGSSSMYEVDRYTFLLRAYPDDDELRFRLVDLLVEKDRFAEAMDVLTAPGRMDVRDSGYAERLRLIMHRREAHARRRVAHLTDRTDGRRLRADELAELASHYATLGLGRRALDTCLALTDSFPREMAEAVYCMRTLAGLGYAEAALAEADRLARLESEDENLHREILLIRLEAGELDSDSMRLLDEMIETADDVELLLAAAGYRVRQGRLEDAKALLDSIPDSRGTPDYSPRREALGILIDRELVRTRIEDTNEVLREARRLSAAGNHREAVAAYERYFEERGRRTRPELLELASVHVAAGEYKQALSILFALEQTFHDADVLKRIARVQMDVDDAGGALASLDRLVAERPRDWEARLWRADVLAGLGYYEEALAVYDDVPEAVGSTYAVDARRTMIQNEMSGGPDVGDWSGLDYAGILAPSADGVRARGGGTAYDRWSQGMQTHVTTPIGLVVLAGIDSHFLSGTRRLVPDSETVRGRVNRIWAGGIFDFTPQIRSDRASYTSRLTFQGGLFDYEGGRTMPFGSVRYWRQEPGVYDGSIGLQSTEGSLDLWSPAGGQYDLRITQINAKGTTTALAPDSTIRVAGNVSVNLITDNLGSTLEGERNIGSNIRLEAGYRIATDTYLGMEYQGIDYRSTVDIYWSPQNYSQYDVFLEYEGESPLGWYLRLRAALGMVARSDGFVTRRLEADFIRRLDENFSISVRTGLSASARSTGSAGASVLDRYNSASFGAALYWTL